MESALERLAALLTRERLLVELVVFKLVELRQLLLAGETRFLGWASEEVERATASVRQTELERAVLVTGIATDRGLSGDELTLSALVEDSPEPWRSLLAETQTALRGSAAEVSDLLAATRRLAEAGSRSLAETLRKIDGAPVEDEPVRTTYGPSARWETAGARPRVSHEL
ncbi:MAG: flagellar biosynthesis protein FlgN [Frankiales bacterium]|nr:flagellar biosynthesis protein FlgN [Frankiales bacterium]